VKGLNNGLHLKCLFSTWREEALFERAINPSHTVSGERGGGGVPGGGNIGVLAAGTDKWAEGV
jgi:hypothetical protein